MCGSREEVVRRGLPAVRRSPSPPGEECLRRFLFSPSVSPPGRLLTPGALLLANTSPSPSLLLLETTMGSEGTLAGDFATTKDVCASPLVSWGVTTLPLLPAVVFRPFPLDGSWLVAAFLMSKAALPNIFASGCSARNVRNRVNQPASNVKKDKQKAKQATT